MIIIVFYSSNKIKIVVVLFYFVKSTLFYSNKIKLVIVLIRVIR